MTESVLRIYPSLAHYQCGYGPLSVSRVRQCSTCDEFADRIMDGECAVLVRDGKVADILEIVK